MAGTTEKPDEEQDLKKNQEEREDHVMQTRVERLKWSVQRRTDAICPAINSWRRICQRKAEVVHVGARSASKARAEGHGGSAMCQRRVCPP